MTALADVASNNGHKPFTEPMMYRIASVTVTHYWYRYYKVNYGLDCQHCSKAQRHKCKDNDLYRECWKAIKLESLSKPVVDAEGNITELGELIADDKAIDLEAWLDEATWRLGCPQRLVDIAQKIAYGIPLNGREQRYWHRYRQKEQKTLF